LLAETLQAMMPISSATAGLDPRLIIFLRPMQFRIADVAYLFAILAISIAAFGVIGIFATAAVTVFWWIILRGKGISLVELVIVIAVLGTMLGLMIPSGMGSRAPYRVAGCRNNLTNLAKALLAFDAGHGHLPQAIVLDAQGRTMHSWRTSILPQLDQQTLANAYDLSQPWDSPKNAMTLGMGIDILECPSDPSSPGNGPHTNYFAIVGPQTAWPEDRGLALSEITDGREATLLLLEVAGWDVPWGEPRDLTYDEALNVLLGKPQPSKRFAAVTHGPVVHHYYGSHGYFYKWHNTGVAGVHAAFADGKVRFLPVPLPEEMAKTLLTANAGDDVDWEEFERLTSPQLDYAKIYATIAFAIVALWPARRAFRKRSVLAPGSSNRG
jgi:type II secretory pathway pseudopilin PulG